VEIKSEGYFGNSAIYFNNKCIKKKARERADIRGTIELPCLLENGYRIKENKVKLSNPLQIFRDLKKHIIHNADEYEYIGQHGMLIEFKRGKLQDLYYHTDHDEQIKCILRVINDKLLARERLNKQMFTEHMYIRGFTEYQKDGMTIYVFVFSFHQRNKRGTVVASMNSESDKDAYPAVQDMLNQRFKRVDLIKSNFPYQTLSDQ